MYSVQDRPRAAPGQEGELFFLKVTCHQGYKILGKQNNLCINGEWYDKMPSCLPICNNDDSTNIVSLSNKNICYVENKINTILQTRFFTNGEDLECGVLSGVPVEDIAGGYRASREELPWHAGIYRKTSTPYMQICGGSLISETTVISAAHCFWNDLEKLLPASNYAVAVGKLYRPWNDPMDYEAQKSDVKSIKIPPHFRGSINNFQEDIAIIVVTTPFHFQINLVPVCVDFDHKQDKIQLSEGKLGKVAGWGLTAENGFASQVLKVVEMPYVSVDKCIDGMPSGFTALITGDKFCAGYTNASTAVCKGDSGGGLSFPRATENGVRYYLRGVVSTAPNNGNLCNVNTWDIFTHVAKHEHFIREHTVQT